MNQQFSITEVGFLLFLAASYIVSYLITSRTKDKELEMIEDFYRFQVECLDEVNQELLKKLEKKK